MIRPPPPFEAKCHRGELSKSAAYILLWRPTFYVGVKSCLYLILNWVYSRTVKPVSGDRNSSMISPGHSGQALTPSATVGHSFGDGVRLSSHLGNRNKLSCPRHDHRIHSGFYSPIAKHFRETISLSTAIIYSVHGLQFNRNTRPNLPNMVFGVRLIWSSGVSMKRSCKMQFRRLGLRSIGPSSQKL